MAKKLEEIPGYLYFDYCYEDSSIDEEHNFRNTLTCELQERKIFH